MKQKRLKSIILTLCLIVIACLSIVTFAWFTDKKEYTGDLTFGEIALDVTGGVDEDAQTLVFDVARTNGAYTQGGKIMPGDTVNINLTVGLKTGSEPAYYLIYVTDDMGVFEENYYFSDGTNVYVYDGTKTYLQSNSSQTVTDKFCGELTTASIQNITIPAKVSADLTKQNIKANVLCKVEAIQQANLDDETASTKLKNLICPVATFSATWRGEITSSLGLTGITTASDITGIRFDKLGLVPTGYQDTGKALSNGVKIYQNTTTNTDISFVYGKIIAPTNCSRMFRLDQDGKNTMELTNLKSIIFKNFDTTNTTDMSALFYSADVTSVLTTLDISCFDTKNVTNMSYMFSYLKNLTSLDMSGFDMTKVTNVARMLDSCTSLTELKAPQNIQSSYAISLPTKSGYSWYEKGASTALTTLAPTQSGKTLEFVVTK